MQKKEARQHNTLTFEKITGCVSIQDHGRWGLQKFGIGTSGAADKLSLLWANQLLDNNKHDAALECLLGPTKIKFNSSATIAITGANQSFFIDDQECTAWSSITVNVGSVVTIPMPKSGLYSYVAIKGGMDIPPVLNSRSISLRENIGPNDGRGFNIGQSISFTNSPSQVNQRSLNPRYIPEYSRNEVIRFIPSKHAVLQALPASIEKNIYTVRADSNKMGVRLKGKPIEFTRETPYSEAVLEGSIQVPPIGEPIILLADHQTIGGYPLLGTVYAVDLPKLAQSRPGTSIQLIEGRLEEAYRLLKKQQSAFSHQENND